MADAWKRGPPCPTPTTLKRKDFAQRILGTQIPTEQSFEHFYFKTTQA